MQFVFASINVSFSAHNIDASALTLERQVEKAFRLSLRIMHQGRW